MFIIIEMEDVNILGTHLCTSRKKADEVFEQIIKDSGEPMQEYDNVDLRRECSGTVRLVGDEVYSIQMIEDCPEDDRTNWDGLNFPTGADLDAFEEQ